MAKGKNKRKMRFERVSLILLVIVGCVYLFGSLTMNSMESAMTVRIQKTQEELDEIQSDIDGLNTARQEKLSFDNIREVAKNQGYTLNYSSENTANNITTDSTTETE